VKILHVSTVHPRTDVRILHKQVVTLTQHFGRQHNVGLLVQDGLPLENNPLGYFIKSAGPKLLRQRSRLLFGIWRMLFSIIHERPGIVHLHDPELLPVGFILRVLGIKVVYDVHEDYREQMLHGNTRSLPLRLCLPKIIAGFEFFADRIFVHDSSLVTISVSQTIQN
jgi:Glycosyltransferase Family 4